MPLRKSRTLGADKLATHFIRRGRKPSPRELRFKDDRAAGKATDAPTQAGHVTFPPGIVSFTDAQEQCLETPSFDPARP